MGMYSPSVRPLSTKSFSISLAFRTRSATSQYASMRAEEPRCPLGVSRVRASGTLWWWASGHRSLERAQLEYRASVLTQFNSHRGRFIEFGLRLEHGEAAS